jgi:glycolate oxidase FAD binding subunit
MRAGSLGIARDLRRGVLRSPLDPLRLVLLDASAAALFGNTAGSEPALWVEVGGSHRVIERCRRELRQLAAAVGAPVDTLEGAEGAWERVCDLARWLQRKYRDVTVLKAALPIAASEELMSRAQQEAESERVTLASFAQVGVGIVYLAILQEELSPNVAALVGRLRQAAADLGGTLVIEHCPHGLKSQLDVWGAAGDDFAAMRKIKTLWDPGNILAPGRFVGGI